MPTIVNLSSSALKVARDLKKLLPEAMLLEFLGEEMFNLRRQLYQIGSTLVQESAQNNADIPRQSVSHVQDNRPLKREASRGNLQTVPPPKDASKRRCIKGSN